MNISNNPQSHSPNFGAYLKVTARPKTAEQFKQYLFKNVDDFIIVKDTFNSKKNRVIMKLATGDAVEHQALFGDNILKHDKYIAINANRAIKAHEKGLFDFAKGQYLKN